MGLDGPHVDLSKAVIDQEQFRALDLSQAFTLSQSFDLALCLEVAEHLPSSSAEGFIASLVSLAPVILFSAAPPGQGGTGHINEQWPRYWQALFSQHQYEMLDCIRPRIWGESDVAWWYRQNMFMVIQHQFLDERPELRNLAVPGRIDEWILVRDHVFKANCGLPTGIRQLTRLLTRELTRRGRQRLGRHP
jgi:hypothetical protein